MILPNIEDDLEAANGFGDFFYNQTRSIRDIIELERPYVVQDNIILPPAPVANPLHSFDSLSSDQVCQLIKDMNDKCCDLDPIPTWLVKKCNTELCPILRVMINKSLGSSLFPENLKQASVKPVIKDKAGDHDAFKNYRPMSNTSFLSKLLEKAALSQINIHIEDNSLHGYY